MIDEVKYIRFSNLFVSKISNKKFSSLKVLKYKIKKKIDLFDRGHIYKKIHLKVFPKTIIKEIKKYKKFLL